MKIDNKLRLIAGLCAVMTVQVLPGGRFSSFLYIGAVATSSIAVYVTFTEEPAPLQAFALATVITLLGYTVSPTIIGHLGLYTAASGTLISLGFQLIDSENLRLYTQLSLVLAFAISWMVLSSIRAVHPEVGFALGAFTIFAASQIAFLREYENLAYAIALAGVALLGWLYFLMRSWVIAIPALITLVVATSEWVIRAMESSMAALVGMFLVGSLVALLSASAISSVPD